LRDDQLARIENLLGRPGMLGRNSVGGNRLFVEPVIWKFRSGEAIVARKRGVSSGAVEPEAPAPREPCDEVSDRGGAPWRDLPECRGGWKNTHTRFSR